MPSISPSDLFLSPTLTEDEAREFLRSFGLEDPAAADQHLQASQMRALETGRWMVRSTNTGVTAAIDPRGRVASRLPAFTTGTLVETVEPRSGMTPYARFGNVPALLLAAAVGLLAILRRRR